MSPVIYPSGTWQKPQRTEQSTVQEVTKHTSENRKNIMILIYFFHFSYIGKWNLNKQLFIHQYSRRTYYHSTIEASKTFAFEDKIILHISKSLRWPIEIHLRPSWCVVRRPLKRFAPLILGNYLCHLVSKNSASYINYIWIFILNKANLTVLNNIIERKLYIYRV